MPNYRPYITDDGSIGLFSGDVDDIFHSRYGALSEAYEKFVHPLDFDNLLTAKELNVLDICYGIGYNTKAFLNTLIKKITCRINMSNSYIPINKECVNDFTNTDSIPADKSSTGNVIQKARKNFQTSLLKAFFLKIINRVFFTKEKSDKLLSDGVNLVVQSLSSQIPIVQIDALEFEREFVDLSPLIKDQCINQEYKLYPFINQFIFNSLIKQYGEEYLNRLQNYTYLETKKKFFDMSILKTAKKIFSKGYKYTQKLLKNASLHNIYYQNLSKRACLNTASNSDKIYQYVSKRLKGNLTLNFHTEDARVSVRNLNRMYDIIFLDAFTPTKLPTLWTVEFFKELYSKIKPEGILLTYSNSARARAAMLEAGFCIGNIITTDNHLVGTIASKSKNQIKHKLSERENGLLGTKAGIPYRDSTLTSSAAEILEALDKEVKTSTRTSSSQYLKGVKNEI